MIVGHIFICIAVYWSRKVDFLQNVTKGGIGNDQIGFIDMAKTVALAGNGRSIQPELVQNMNVKGLHRAFSYLIIYVDNIIIHDFFRLKRHFPAKK